jgi:hypothetical protein
MENAVYDDLSRTDFVEDAVWEPPNERSTHRWIDEREGLRMPLDRPETCIDSGKEGYRAIRRLPVVPEVSLVEIKLSTQA